MQRARKRVEELSKIDPATAKWIESMASAEALVAEVSHTLREYLGRLEADPARLDQVESRLAALEKLKRKYGDTLAEVVAFYDATRRQLDSAETAESRRGELKKNVDRAAADFQESAGRLSQLRKEAAARLEKKVERELATLAMDRTRFRVAFQDAPWTESGFDAVEFLIAPNAGEEPRPLDRIASGGELSRAALALKACTVGAASPSRPGQRTLVFDEVDAGIGGRAAESVGRRLKTISSSNQVLCVTHLAQIAGFADHHFSVEKCEIKGRTCASIEELQGESRTREIGRMLSGQVTPEALKHAEQLIRLGQGS
jgi:DNA repair protein RecN (Recombination protein N)